jgi:hypothetical protein
MYVFKQVLTICKGILTMELLSAQAGNTLYLQATGTNNLIILAVAILVKLYPV